MTTKIDKLKKMKDTIVIPKDNEEKYKIIQDELDKDKRTQNLKMITNSKMAREMGKKAVEANKRRKKEARELKEFWQYSIKNGLLNDEDGVKAIDVLKFLMKRAFFEEDYDTAGDYAEKIAQYETPKLSSQSVLQKQLDLKDLSDEEFQKELAKLDINVPISKKDGRSDANPTPKPEHSKTNSE